MQIENTEQVGYRKGIVYALVCEETGDVYIGSTFNFPKRKRGHKDPSTRCVSKEIINRGNYYYEIIEEHYFPNKVELRKLEQNHIDKCLCINKRKAYLTENEKIQYIKEQNKKYYRTHIERINKVIPCECGGKYMQRHKKKHEETKKHKKYVAFQVEDS